MATEVVMPKLGLTMEKGTLGAWLIEEGQRVEKGAPLLEVITDKVTMEVEAQASGLLRKILVPAGEEVEVAVPIGIIGDEDEDISHLVQASPSQAAPQAVETATGVGRESAAPPAPQEGERMPHRASPKARKMAIEQGIDLKKISGSGPGGRIVSADIQAYLAQPSAGALEREAATAPLAVLPATAESLIKLTRPQLIAAERLTTSSRDIPHIHVSMEVSAVWLQQFREGYRLEGKKISYNDLIVKGTSRVLVEFPRLNSVLEGNAVRPHQQVNIGIAVDTPQGLLVPVLHQAPGKSIEEIAAESNRLVDAARHGNLGPDDLSGGTFTITNLGMFGVSRFTAIINPPEVAILAVGAVEPRVVPLAGDAVAVRPQLTLTLGADHRVVDGALAARFLKRLQEILETPGLLA